MKNIVISVIKRLFLEQQEAKLHTQKQPKMQKKIK
jgi:hypothetical protein